MRLLDISHVLDENTPVFPGEYPTTLTVQKTRERDGYAAYLLQSCLHVGTHIDMPMHLLDDHRTVSDFPLDGFCGQGVLLDVRGEEAIGMKPVYEDIVTPGSVVLLWTGWDSFFHKNGGQDDYFARHPVVGDELAAFLLSRGIKILGMDMPSPDYVPYTFHKALLANGTFVLENLTNLQGLSGVTSFEVMAFPLKIAAEASLVRAVCRIPDSN